MKLTVRMVQYHTLRKWGLNMVQGDLHLLKNEHFRSSKELLIFNCHKGADLLNSH